MLYGTQRETYRQVFVDAWREYRAGRPVQGAARLIVQALIAHPEYQALVEDPDRALAKDFMPESGETNPFLHLGLHIGVEEQLALDSPAGIRALFEAACRRLGDVHEAQHCLMDCLAEAIWCAQREGRAPDMAEYLACVRARLGPAPH